MDILIYGKTIFTQTVIMALLMLIGYVLAKMGKLSRPTIAQLTDLVFWVVTPCVIIHSFLDVQFDASYIIKMLEAAGLALFSHLAGYAAGFVFYKVRPNSRRTVYRFGSMISNAGFMALPLAQAVFSGDGVLLVSIYVIMVNIFNWTLGRAMFKSEEKVPVRKMVFNPGVIGVILGVLAALLKQVYLPSMISDTVSYLSALNTPLAMLVTGFYLVGTSVRSCVKDGFAWLTAFIRQIGLPVVLMLLYHFVFGVSGLLLQSAVLAVSAPCAVIVVMFSARFGGDEKIASQTVSLSTVTSILTMPLMLMLAQLL